MKIGTYIVCAGVPALFFLLIAQFFIKNVYWIYIFYCLATTAAGIGLSYLAPILTSKCKITKLLPGAAEAYQEHLEVIN